MRLHLAATETPLLMYGWLPKEQTNIFMSYFNVRRVTRCIHRVTPRRAGRLVIDSGAHSFFGFVNLSATRHIRMKNRMPDPHVYFRGYCDWLISETGRWDYFVELDLQELVGMETVEEWRKEYQRLDIARGCISVWHSSDGWPMWERMTAESESRYIGIEGLRKGRAALPYLKHIEYAYKRGCRVHGFAMVKRDCLNRYPFYSTDSSSWMAACRYGKLPIFNLKTGRLQFKWLDPKAMAASLIPQRLARQNSKDREVAGWWQGRAEEAYLQLERHVTDLWRMRGVVWE